MPTNLQKGQNFDVSFRELPSDYAMKTLDTATDHYNIGYVLSGDRKTILLDGYYTVHPGYITIMAPYVYHRTVSMSSMPYQRYQIKFTKEIAAPLIHEIGPNIFKQLNDMNYIPINAESQPEFLKQFIDMNQIYHENNPHKEFVLQGMLNRLMIDLLTYCNENNPDYARTINTYANSLNKQIVDAIYYIENNYKNNPSLEETAQAVFLSKYYFSHLFKEQIGQTYTEYLNNVKLQHARELLIKTSRSVSDIAIEVGFPNGNYLCDVFKKYINISPLNFRKLNKNHES